MFSHFCASQTFKIGAFASFHRDVVRFSNSYNEDFNLGDNIIYRYKTGVRASYSPWYKISIEPGLAISTSKFKLQPYRPP